MHNVRMSNSATVFNPKRKYIQYVGAEVFVLKM